MMTPSQPRLSTWLFCIVWLSFAVPVQAQDADDASPLLRGSNRAITFSIDDLRLGGLDGGVGVRWYIAPNVALRTSFNLGVESTEDVIENSTDDGLSAFSTGVSLLVEWHTQAFRRVSPYLTSGFGIGVEAFSSTTDFGLESPIRQRRRKGSFLDFEVEAGFGVEVFVTRSISLAGEHQALARVRTGDEELKEFMREGQGDDRIINRDIRSFTFGTGTSSLIVSIFF